MCRHTHLLVEELLKVFESVDDDVSIEEGSCELKEGERDEACLSEGGSVAEAEDRSLHLDRKGGERFGSRRSRLRRHVWKL